MKKILTVLIAVMLLAGFSSVSWALELAFTQNAGFNTTLGTLLSDESGGTVATNDIRWTTTTGLAAPSGYSVVYPTAPYVNTITWGGSDNNGGQDNTNHWGNSNYSGLRVVGFAGNATVGDWETISTIYHQNSSISSSLATLVSAEIHALLTVGTADENTIPITFNETLNTLNIGPSSLWPGPDEWVFNPAGFAPVLFTYGGIDYMAEFQLANLTNAVLVDNTTSYSLWTREDFLSSADVQMRLTEVPNAIPEPMSMVLLGSGLLGVFFRRKSAR